MVDDYPAEARRAIEAILMVADEPIEPQILAQVTEVAETTVERPGCTCPLCIQAQ